MNKQREICNLGPFSLLKKIKEDANSIDGNNYYYCMVNNIPLSFHAADLRNFFAEFTEANKFDIFHFRHRPQIIRAKGKDEVLSTYNESSQVCSEMTEDKPTSVHDTTDKKLCCPVRFIDVARATEFVRKYDKKVWMDKMGNDLTSKCMVSLIPLSKEDLTNFSSKEFGPPLFMPRGNIGCPNSHFLRLIKDCKLPPSLIKKLGIEFPRARRFRKYCKVPYDYGTRIDLTAFPEEEEIRTGRGHTIQSVIHNRMNQTSSERVESANESDADDDEDRCEEWERHEALHDEVTSHGGVYSQTKERLYEEKIELKWEKGGSGLVFYTDAQYWDEEKGGFDERTADDWDVDMEGYYVPGGGDKDARDFLEMRQSERFQKGLEHISVFSRSESHYRRRAKSSSPTPSTSGKIGDFEKYTKGIGRKLMEKQGWHDGIGIGKSTIGMVDALVNDGKGPRDKCGLGYYGEKLELGASKKRPKKFHDYSLDADDRVIIGTIYDKPEELDVEEPLLRRNAPTFVKRYDVQTQKTSKLVKRV